MQRTDFGSALSVFADSAAKLSEEWEKAQSMPEGSEEERDVSAANDAYPSYLPSFDEFVHDLLTLRDAVEERQRVQRITSEEARALIQKYGVDQLATLVRLASADTEATAKRPALDDLPSSGYRVDPADLPTSEREAIESKITADRTSARVLTPEDVFAMVDAIRPEGFVTVKSLRDALATLPDGAPVSLDDGNGWYVHLADISVQSMGGGDQDPVIINRGRSVDAQFDYALPDRTVTVERT